MAETKRVGSLAGLALLALLLSACFTTSPRMHGLAADFSADLPEVELEHQFGMTFGRMSLGMVKGIAKWGMDEEDRDAFQVFKGVKKVEMATFEAVGSGDVRFTRRLETSLERRGWETLARFRDGDELGWVVYRLDGERLKNVMVVVHDHGELLLVRLGGRLDRVVSAALQFSRDEVLGDDWIEEEWQDDAEDEVGLD